MPPYIYFQKEYMPLADAKIGMMTNFIHYGTAAIEGIRGNWNDERKQLYLFRLKEHYERLLSGCRILKMDLPYTIDDFSRITVETIRKGGFREDVYVRPMAYKSTEAIGVRLHNLESDFAVFAFPWGPYLDMDKARCSISSWRRPREVPQAKLSGLYINSALAKTEAIESGFHEALMLTADGYVSEGSGENIFLVQGNQLITPPPADVIIVGITRDTIIRLAKNELGMDTVERRIEHSELYTAHECFLTGTAANVTPVGEIDRRHIGNGEVGEITARLRRMYFDVIQGKNPEYLDWCTPVYPE